MAKTYDLKCFRLGLAFLEDHPELNTPEARVTLAITIQDAIEGEINFMRSQLSPARKHEVANG